MARTGELPGTEAFIDKKLSAMATEYSRIMRRRVKLLSEETALKEKIIDRLHELKIKSYHDDDEEITLKLSVEKEKLTVKVKKDEEDGDAD